jgi:DNA-directed RNA polymerase subunit H (RpoH/RPB5)
MKKQILTLFVFALSFFAQCQTVKLKKIASVETNTTTGEKITKNYFFNEGKLASIKTSDIVQSFFYNKNGDIDRTVRENEVSSWKEVASYYYDDKNRLSKYVNDYDGGGTVITKTITFKYEGSKITAITKRSNSSLKFVQYIDYGVKDWRIASETERDLNQKIVSNRLIDYQDNNLVTYKGVVGDKATDIYVYDEKKSAMQLLVKNVFGVNYKINLLLIAPHEREFAIENMSNHNFLKFTSTKSSKKEYSYSYTYNELDYPKTHTHIDGVITTTVTYDYE